MSNKDIENDKKLDKEDAEVVGTEIAIIDDRSIRWEDSDHQGRHGG